MLKESYAIMEKLQVSSVLILILMEHAQRDSMLSYLYGNKECLNPYFNGTCSKSYQLCGDICIIPVS